LAPSVRPAVGRASTRSHCAPNSSDCALSGKPRQRGERQRQFRGIAHTSARKSLRTDTHDRDWPAFDRNTPTHHAEPAANSVSQYACEITVTGPRPAGRPVVSRRPEKARRT
jgi:hypothetical protein